jgi:hypothetical protein
MNRRAIAAVFYICTGFFCPFAAAAPDSVFRSSFLVFSFHTGFLNLKDLTVSPVWYSGPSGGAALEWKKEKSAFQSSITGRFSYGLLSRHFSAGKASSIMTNLDYQALWGASSSSFFSCGFRSGFLAHYRYNEAWGNSSGTYENIMDIAPSVRYSRTFVLKERFFSFRKLRYFRPERKYRLNIAADYAPAGIVSRTPYPGIADFTSGGTPAFPGGDFRLKGPAGFSRIGVSTEIVRFLRNGANLFGISYRWNFYSVREPNPVKSAAHSLSFSFYFLSGRRPCSIC